MFSCTSCGATLENRTKRPGQLMTCHACSNSVVVPVDLELSVTTYEAIRASTRRRWKIPGREDHRAGTDRKRLARWLRCHACGWFLTTPCAIVFLLLVLIAGLLKKAPPDAKVVFALLMIPTLLGTMAGFVLFFLGQFGCWRHSTGAARSGFGRSHEWWFLGVAVKILAVALALPPLRLLGSVAMAFSFSGLIKGLSLTAFQLSHDPELWETFERLKVLHRRVFKLILAGGVSVMLLSQVKLPFRVVAAGAIVLAVGIGIFLLLVSIRFGRCVLLLAATIEHPDSPATMNPGTAKGVSNHGQELDRPLSAG